MPQPPSKERRLYQEPVIGRGFTRRVDKSNIFPHGVDKARRHAGGDRKGRPYPAPTESQPYMAVATLAQGTG